MTKAKIIMYDARNREFVTAIYHGVVRGFVPKKKDREIISIDNLIPIGGPFLLQEDAETPAKALTGLVKEINNYKIEGVDVLAVGGTRIEPYTEIDKNTFIYTCEARIEIFHNILPPKPMFIDEPPIYGAQIAVQEYRFK